MKNYGLIAFALAGIWLISNPYNAAVMSQSMTVFLDEIMVDNAGQSRKETAERILARSQLELMQLKAKRDSVQ